MQATIRVDKRVPLNTAIIAFRRSRWTIKMFDELYRIAWRSHVLDGQRFKPRLSGWWEQDAFGIYIRKKGDAHFRFLEHGIIQSFVKGLDTAGLYWKPGHFAADFTGAPEETLVKIAEAFIKRYVKTEAG
eukprot:TRINITY_DN18556_c0_g1_i3.p3 TRINITY_DN18556_c0_g1~~TRINITY_DN18556_c0_g1_i3.p3  ORF type:complete len:130 (-),score=21.73 TRINITY_DN18556_c0_g1_i3:641-1030(-)